MLKRVSAQTNVSSPPFILNVGTGLGLTFLRAGMFFLWLNTQETLLLDCLRIRQHYRVLLGVGIVAVPKEKKGKRKTSKLQSLDLITVGRMKPRFFLKRERERQKERQ